MRARHSSRKRVLSTGRMPSETRALSSSRGSNNASAIPIAAVDGAQYVEQHARVRDLVLRDRREGQIFFDVGDPAGPLAQSVTQDQLVVGQREQQRGARVTHA